MKTKRLIDPPNDTKILLDRIISWEKDLSEYPSLEEILRSQFLIIERKATDGYNEMERLTKEVSEQSQKIYEFQLKVDAEQALRRVLTAESKQLREALREVIRHGLLEIDGYETVLKKVHEALTPTP